MADRHHGFGAYDVPFLGPTHTGMKDQSESAADAEVNQGNHLQHASSGTAWCLVCAAYGMGLLLRGCYTQVATLPCVVLERAHQSCLDRAALGHFARPCQSDMHSEHIAST